MNPAPVRSIVGLLALLLCAAEARPLIGQEIQLSDVGIPGAIEPSAAETRAWLEEVRQDVRAGRVVLIPADPPLEFLVVDPDLVQSMSQIGGEDILSLADLEEHASNQNEMLALVERKIEELGGAPPERARAPAAARGTPPLATDRGRTLPPASRGGAGGLGGGWEFIVFAGRQEFTGRLDLVERGGTLSGVIEWEDGTRSTLTGSRSGTGLSLELADPYGDPVQLRGTASPDGTEIGGEAMGSAGGWIAVRGGVGGLGIAQSMAGEMIQAAAEVAYDAADNLLRGGDFDPEAAGERMAGAAVSAVSRGAGDLTADALDNVVSEDAANRLGEATSDAVTEALTDALDLPGILAGGEDRGRRRGGSWRDVLGGVLGRGDDDRDDRRDANRDPDVDRGRNADRGRDADRAPRSGGAAGQLASSWRLVYVDRRGGVAVTRAGWLDLDESRGRLSGRVRWEGAGRTPFATLSGDLDGLDVVLRTDSGDLVLSGEVSRDGARMGGGASSKGFAGLWEATIRTGEDR